MKHFNFYVQHAFRDLMRNGRRTAFALFCVAAGVAAIVALRSLSLMISDSLSSNLGALNHGDISVTVGGNSANSGGMNMGGADFSANTSTDGRNAFTAEQIDAITAWAKANNVQFTTTISDANIQLASLDAAQTAGRPQFIGSYVIDPKVYPYYGPVVAIDPPGKPLSELFTGGNDVVISKNLATANNIKVGDQVRVGRTTELFTVRGIVPTESEGNLQNLISSFFGFAYFDQAQSKVLQLDPPLPDQIYMQTPQDADLAALKTSLKNAVSGTRITTLLDVRQQNRTISDLLDRFIIIMGLAALLIGGTGIIHTMLVVVSRRTVEIAVLKTLGVQGNQITLMFLIESVIMGFLGSLLGIVLGILLSVAVRAFFQSAWPQSLEWRLYPQAMGTGLLLGVIITAVFGFLPTLTAAAVRPAVVLRPNETGLPRAGFIATLFTVLGVVIVIGLIAGQLIGNLLIGLIGIAFASLMMAVVVVMLYVLIAIIGKLPAFGLVDLRLALRGIGTHRTRTASTLLALIVGIFSLSLITLTAQSVPTLLNDQFARVFGGNVLVFELIPFVQRPMVVSKLKDKPGVTNYNQVGIYSGKLTAVNGDTDWASKVKLNMPGIMNASPQARNLNNNNFLPQALGSIGTTDVAAPAFESAPVVSGRALTAADAGQPNITMSKNTFSEDAGINVGAKLTFTFGGKSVDFTVVGVTDPEQAQTSGGANFVSNSGVFTAPVDAFPAGMNPTIEFVLARVDDANLNKVLLDLSTIPGIFPIDISFFEKLIRRLLEQFTAIPTIVALLSLFAGAVIIANTVSLTTLERRRQVGVMKAIGLPASRVLLQMVIENGLIGLLGGVIGVGIGLIGTLLMSIGSQIPISQTISWGTVALLMGLSLSISLVATLLSAWTATTEKPLNVLRYE